MILQKKGTQFYNFKLKRFEGYFPTFSHRDLNYNLHKSHLLFYFEVQLIFQVQLAPDPKILAFKAF